MCVCVCPTRDIRNGRSNHHTPYTVLKSFVWRVVQTVSRAYTMCCSREKAFGSFSPVTCLIPCMHRYTSGTLGRMNIAHYKKAVGTFSNGMHYRTCPPHHGYHCCYWFLHEWAINTPHEPVTDILRSINSCLNSTRS